MKFIPIFILLIGSIGCSSSDYQEPSIVFEKVTTIDAINGSQEDQTVIIRGKRIIETGPSNEIDIPSNSTIINGQGKFLIPGLWDAHVHLSYQEDISPVMFSMFLVNGITSIRDTGGQLDLVMPWKEKSLLDDGSSPRVMVAGPLLDGVPTVYNGVGGRPKIGVGAASPEEAEALVDAFVEAGVDFIKSYEMLTPESFAAVLARAKRYGKQVTGHVPLSMDVTEASNLGLRSMEHMRNLEMSCSSDFDSLKNARQEMLTAKPDQQGGDLRSSIHSAQRYHSIQTQDSERRDFVLSVLAKNNTWQVPTLTIVGAWENRVFDRESWKANFRFLPKLVRKRWIENADSISQIPSTAENIAFANWAYDMVKRIDDAGIGIMAGTDTPIFFLTPGFSLHEELRLLVKSGLSTIKALEAATLNPSKYFDLDNELGVIDKGMIADLVLLNANPLDDITNTKKINAVMKSGKLYKREDLDRILQQLETN